MEFYESAKDDASGVDHPEEVREKVGDIFVLGSIQEGMQYTSKHTSKHVLDKFAIRWQLQQAQDKFEEDPTVLVGVPLRALQIQQ